MTFTTNTDTVRAAYHLAAGTEATGLQTYEEVDDEFNQWLAEVRRDALLEYATATEIHSDPEVILRWEDVRHDVRDWATYFVD